jgi:hypothetical protein
VSRKISGAAGNRRRNHGRGTGGESKKPATGKAWLAPCSRAGGAETKRRPVKKIGAGGNLSRAWRSGTGNEKIKREHERNPGARRDPGSTRSCPRTEDQNRRRRRALLAKREPRKTLSAIENLAARGDPQGANYDVTFELRFTQPTGDRLTRNSRSHAADRKQYQRAELKSHSKKSIVQIQHKGKNERHKQHKKSIFLL